MHYLFLVTKCEQNNRPTPHLIFWVWIYVFEICSRLINNNNFFIFLKVFFLLWNLIASKFAKFLWYFLRHKKSNKFVSTNSFLSYPSRQKSILIFYAQQKQHSTSCCCTRCLNYPPNTHTHWIHFENGDTRIMQTNNWSFL